MLFFIAGGLLLSAGITILNEESLQKIKNTTKIKEIDTKDIAASASLLFKNEDKNNSTSDNVNTNKILTEIKMETSKSSMIIPPRVEVYDGLTLEELAEKVKESGLTYDEYYIRNLNK